MRTNPRSAWFAAAASMLLAFLALSATGCKSYWVDATVENKSGEAIRELEVQYPTASFGADSLAAGAVMHYRFQIRGSGPVRVSYAAPGGKTAHAQGPALTEHDQGQLLVRLLPGGKVEFLPNLKPAS